MQDPGYGRYLASAAEEERNRRHRSGMFYDELALQQDKWDTEKRGIDYKFGKKKAQDEALTKLYEESVRQQHELGEYSREGEKFFDERYDPKGDMWERRRAKRAGEDYNSIWQILGGNIAGSWRANVKDPLLGQYGDFERFKEKPGGKFGYEDKTWEIIQPLIEAGALDDEGIRNIIKALKLKPQAGGSSNEIKNLLNLYTRGQGNQ